MKVKTLVSLLFYFCAVLSNSDKLKYKGFIFKSEGDCPVFPYNTKESLHSL